jgi:ATP-binding cassette, subfamily B, bacterial
MDKSAYFRCKQFLNYHAAAKWLSISSSLGTAVLYLALVGALALYIDLVVERGELPSFHHLSIQEQQRFLNEIALPTEQGERAKRVQQVHAEMKALGFDGSLVREWAEGEAVEKWSPNVATLLWWAELPQFLEGRVGPLAAEKARGAIKNSVQQHGMPAAEDCGLLSLVVRGRYSFWNKLIGVAASWNEWMWAHGNHTYLLGLFVGAASLASARLVLLFLANYFGAVAVVEAITRLRRAVYQHSNRLSSLAVRAPDSSEAVGISAHHLESVHDGLFQWLTVYFREPAKVVLLIVFTLLLNFWLALAFLLFALLVWLVGGQVASYYRRQGRVAQKRASDQLLLLQESLMLMRLVKVFLMEPFNSSRVERQLAGYARAQLQRYRGEAIYLPLFLFLGLIAVLALLLVAGYVILSGQLSVTSTVVLASAIISLYWPILAFIDARRIVRRCHRSANVLFHFLDRTGGVGQSVDAEFIPALADAIYFEKVSLKEPGTDRFLLKDINLTIRAGEKIAIVGADEIQKHALVFLLPRFLDPSSGDILIDGKSLRWVTLDSLRTQIAMVLQQNLVFSDTVANNIACGEPAFNMQRIIEAAKVAHAHQFILKLPKGYETTIGELGHALTLSEMFRIALARAILRDPAILIIEEPITPLDEDSKGVIDDTLQRILPGRTVIFLPHRLSTIRACDQVYLLHHGRIEASGEHRELLNRSDLYRHLQYMEFNEYNDVASPSALTPQPNHQPTEMRGK